MDRKHSRAGHFPLLLLAALLSALATSSPTRAASPEQVQAAIDKAQKWLLDKQGKDGTWELVPRPELSTNKDSRQIDLKARQWGGLTSIATYALIASGANPQDAKIKQAIGFLQKANIQSTYGLGLSSQVWLLIPQTKETKAVMAHNVKMLEAGMVHTKGPANGFYGYWTGTKLGSDSPRWTDNVALLGPQPQWWHDLSNSQYAVLGMWALAEAGEEVSTDYWKKVETAWQKAQQDDGGWKYNEGDARGVEASMTAAGIATLFITQDYTLPDRWGVCRGGLPNTHIQAGLKWMDEHIDQIITQGDLYTMYGIERIGVASGRKYFGTVDWYAKGSDLLVSRQGGDGAWGDIPNTCFALLFLARGSAPVMMNKLEYQVPLPPKGVGDPWDERPRDAANIARWVGAELERDLNWQIVNLKVAPEELHDAPILYITGSLDLGFTQQEVDKLRTFVQQGGMILANADCATPAFAKSFIRLGQKVFPKYEFRDLPSSHPIFTREQYSSSKWRVRPKVLGLSNGIRELMLLVPEADLSRAWQSRADRTREEAFQLGADIFLYSVDKKNLVRKGATYVVTADPKVTAEKTIKVARLIIGPNPDPEPAGWARLAAIMHDRYKTDLTVVDAVPGQGQIVGAVPVAHLTGTTAFTLPDAARLEIKAFVNGGGSLIVDAAGGAPEFANSAEAELRTMFGPAAKQLDTPLPANSPLYNQKDLKLTTFGYRAYAYDTLLGRSRQPRLRAIESAKRYHVFYSREDLTEGLVGEPVDGVYGYDPKTATDLMAAMLLYATNK